MSLTFNVTFSTKTLFCRSLRMCFMLVVFAFHKFFSRKRSLSQSHTEENMVSRNLFDGFVYMEKCLAVAWVKFRDENVSCL